MKKKFFFHYDRPLHMIFVNVSGQDMVVQDLECRVPVRTEWSLTQPKLKLVGEADNIEIQGEKLVIYDN